MANAAAYSRRRGRKRARTVSFAEPNDGPPPEAGDAAPPVPHSGLPARSNPRNWRCGPQYKIHDKGYLGRGSYGEVAEATDLTTGAKVSGVRWGRRFAVGVAEPGRLAAWAPGLHGPAKAQPSPYLVHPREHRSRSSE